MSQGVRMVDLVGRSFLKEVDFTKEEFTYLVDLAAELKAAKKARREAPMLEGLNLALIFEKTSTRTRAAFEVAAYDQGAHVTYLDPSGSQIGHKESPADTAPVSYTHLRAHETRHELVCRLLLEK